MNTPLQYGKHLLSLLESAGQLTVSDGQVNLGEPLWPWFMGEKTVTPPWVTPQAYFWQRLCRAVSEAESAFYRFSLPNSQWPGILSDLEPPVWIFWTIAHFEAPRLVEDAIAFAVDTTQVKSVPLDFMMNDIAHLNPEKLHVPEEQLAEVFARLQAACPELLASRTDEIRAEMSGVLKTELERIHVYYDSLLKNRAVTDETRFLLQEREQLIREHYRRLSPDGLRIHMRVQFGLVLTRAEA